MVPARWLRTIEQRCRVRLVAQRRRSQLEIILDALLHEQPPAFRRQREALAHDRKCALSTDLLSAKPDRAGMHRDQAGNGVENRGFATPVGAEQRDNAALRHLQRHIRDPDQVAVANFQMFDLEQGRHVAGPPMSSIGVWAAAALAARLPR
jgi:hypothetical protein